MRLLVPLIPFDSASTVPVEQIIREMSAKKDEEISYQDELPPLIITLACCVLAKFDLKLINP